MRVNKRRRSEKVANPRWVATTALARAFPGLVLLWTLLIGLTGALPAVFALLVAQVVTQLPPAIRDGFTSSAGHALAFTLAAVASVLLADALVSAARGFVQTDLYRRYEEYLLARVMRAALAPAGMELFEEPDLAGRLDKVAMLANLDPGDLVDGLGAKWSIRVQGLASMVLVATVWPLAAVAVGAVWLLVGWRLQADYRLLEAEGGSLAMRRAGYLKQVAIMPSWAKELRIFGLVDWLVDGYRRHRMMVIDQMADARQLSRRTWTLTLTAVIVSNFAVLLWAAHSLIDGSLTAGAVTVLVQGLAGMAMLANQEGDLLIGWGASRIPDVINVENGVASLLHGQRTPVGGPGATTVDLHTGGDLDGLPRQSIQFEQVSFTYPGRTDAVCKELDLTIPAGQSLAIVGLNGAGKTTLAKLLTGLETPQSGRISVDGVDLADIDVTSWRRTVAAIFQDFVHYQLPAVDNIGFGAIDQLHATDAHTQAEQAAARAGAAAILDQLPNGLGTPLSATFTGGVDLSGGQWQRIALARAMRAVAAGARLLILDEPSAHLDVRAEADLYDRFLDLTHGLTTIVISHRFSTVRRADRIIVLDGGQVIEDGSHDELLAIHGNYARLFNRQASHYIDDSHDADDSAAGADSRLPESQAWTGKDGGVA